MTRVVRITPTADRLRKLERRTRGDRATRVRIRIRARDADGHVGAQRLRAQVR